MALYRWVLTVKETLVIMIIGVYILIIIIDSSD